MRAINHLRDLLDKAEDRKAEADNINLAPLGNKLAYASLPVNYRSDGAVLGYVDKLFKEKLKGSELVGEDITELTSYQQAVRPGRVKEGYVRTEVLQLEEVSLPAPPQPEPVQGEEAQPEHTVRSRLPGEADAWPGTVQAWCRGPHNIGQTKGDDVLRLYIACTYLTSQ